MIHRLKIAPQYLNNVINHSKKCEIRFNDKDFQKGDIIYFCDLNGKETDHLAEITHVLHFPDGLQNGYVALSFYLLEEKLKLGKRKTK